MNLEAFKADLKKLVLKFSTSQKFMQVKTVDGKTMECQGDKMETGMPCTIDGKPAPDGEYQLEDGSSCTIKGGIMTAHKPKEEMEQTKEKEVAALMASMKTEIEKSFGEFKTALDEVKGLKEKFEALGKDTTKNLNELNEKLKRESDFSKQVFSLLEKIPEAETPKPSDQNHAPDVMDEVRKFKKEYLHQ